MYHLAAIVCVVALAAFAGPVLADAVPDSSVSAVDTAAIAAVGAPTGDSSVQANDSLALADDSLAQAKTGRAAASFPMAADGTGSAPVNDSLTRVNDSLARAQAKMERAAPYSPAPADSAGAFNPRSLNAADIFRSDGADAAEALRYRALTSVYVPFTLSGSLNRTLPYGSPALTAYPAAPLSPLMLSVPSPRFWGGGAEPAVIAYGFDVGPEAGILYRPHPDALTPPELSVFWENGVFEQNTLNLRLNRPLTQNLMLSAFASYRYLRGQRFNHERNDIVNVYRLFNPDTSTIMNHGYNPLVDEHTLGGALLRANADSSKLRASFSYANLQNEYALNTRAQSLDRLNWALLDRRVYRVEAALLDKRVGRTWRADVKTAFVNEALKTSYQPDTTLVNGRGESANFMIGADFTSPKNWGLSVESLLRNIEFYDGTEELFSESYAELFYRRRLSARTRLHARAGMMVSPWQYTTYYNGADFSDDDSVLVHEKTFMATPNLGAAFEYLSRDSTARLNVFIKSDYRMLYPEYDSDTTSREHGFGRMNVLGAEGEMRSRYLGLLLGYQLYSGYARWKVWPVDIQPYAQPIHTVIIAPWASRYRGFSLLSRAIITDTKPYLKASANLSYTVQPRGMAHTFETELGFDYWSERDPFLFAGHTGWNEPIYDVNLKVTAHIRTFRLFYKIDNLLNLRQAYVPGYFSPGLTFRWGLNWFIQ